MMRKEKLNNMMGNITLYVIGYKYCTFDQRLAVAYANACRHWSTPVNYCVCSHSRKDYSKFIPLEEYLSNYYFNWFYAVIQHIYDNIDLDNWKVHWDLMSEGYCPEQDH